MIRKNTILLLILIINAGYPMNSISGENMNMPTFPTGTSLLEKDIAEWVNSAWGGGRTEHFNIEYGNQKYDVLVAYRSVTSGRNSTELTFFVKDKDVYVMALYYPMRWGEYLQVAQLEDKLVVKSLSSETWAKGEQVYMEIKYSALINGLQTTY
jgi:hypothetical protein